MNRILSHPRLWIVALCALLASGLAMAGTSSETNTDATGQASAQLVTRYTALAGSESNAKALIQGLQSGSQITLSSASGDTTFTPATGAMGYGEVNISLALAQAELAAAGITSPTASQLEAALNGGTVTLSDGSTLDMQGILGLRASGAGWGQVAKTLGLNLGAIVSSSHTAMSQAGMHGSADAKAHANAQANLGAGTGQEAGLRGTAQAQANIDAHGSMGARPDVSGLPVQRPTRPTMPQRPDIPSHAGRPGN